MHRFTPMRHPRGFTLIELLVVVAIIGILAAITFPIFSKAREKARQTTCLSNQRQIAAAVAMYLQENEDFFPAASIFWGKLDLGKKVLQCPTQEEDNAIGYVYNAHLDKYRLAQIFDPTSTVLTADGTGTNNLAQTRGDLDARHQKQTTVSFVDGHVERRKPEMVSLIFYGHKYTSLDELKLLYNIEFVSTDTQNAYDDSDTICSDPSLEEVTAYVPLLLEEYSCYPSSLFEERANGFSLVQKIILVKELKHEGHERNGVAYASYILRDEQPTSWTGVIRYDVEKNNTASLRRTVNHELFHLMDRMSYLPGDAHDDPEWAALNPPSFSYSGDKGASGTHVDTLYGFYSAYGQSSAIEDKATIYQLVVAEPKHLLEHYNRDDIYKVKVELIKKRLQAFWPAMDYMFWKYVNERVIRVR